MDKKIISAIPNGNGCKEYKTLGDKSPLHIIVIDEIDSVLTDRKLGRNAWEKTQVNQFLTEIDGIHQIKNILVIGITNRFEDLDPAATRPGRLGVHIHVPLPTLEHRKSIIDYYLRFLREASVLSKEIESAVLAEKTDTLSGADINGIISSVKKRSFTRIVELCFKENVSYEELEKHSANLITMNDFQQAIDESKKLKLQQT